MITAVIMRVFEQFHVAKHVRPLELDHVCNFIYNGEGCFLTSLLLSFLILGMVIVTYSF